MIGYVTHIQEKYGGEMPSEWEKLVAISHVKRKIASLLMQDGILRIPDIQVKYLTCDVHVSHILADNDWVPEDMKNNRKANLDRMAQYFETWFLSYKQEKKLFVGGGDRDPIGLRSVNAIYGCIRQHYSKKGSKALFADAAEEMKDLMGKETLENLMGKEAFNWDRLVGGIKRK